MNTNDKTKVLYVDCSDPRLTADRMENLLANAGLHDLAKKVREAAPLINNSIALAFPGGAGGSVARDYLFSVVTGGDKQYGHFLSNGVFLNDIGVHIKQHQPKTVFVRAHQDCGAQGSEERLRELLRIVRDANPDTEFRGQLWLKQGSERWELTNLEPK